MSCKYIIDKLTSVSIFEGVEIISVKPYNIELMLYNIKAKAYNIGIKLHNIEAMLYNIKAKAHNIGAKP